MTSSSSVKGFPQYLPGSGPILPSQGRSGPQADDLARMEQLWSAAATILGGRDLRLWAQYTFDDFRNGEISPMAVARASDEGLQESLAYLQKSRERLIDWGWTCAASIWRAKPKRRKQESWTWINHPDAERRA